MKKILSISILILTMMSVSCTKENLSAPLVPRVPQGNVSREFLSSIRVSRDGSNFMYWNENSPSLKVLKDFVARVTDPDSPDFVPAHNRVATFDVDGTLLCETAPTYFNWMFFLHRYLHDDTYTPSPENRAWAQMVEDTLMATGSMNDDEWGDKEEILQAEAFRGMSQNQFESYVHNFITTEKVYHYEGLTWGTALYWPMIEAVSYLVANDFVVFICSGVDRDICRVLCKDIYDIESYHIIASDVHYVLENQDGWVELLVNSEGYDYTPGEQEQRGDFLQLCTAINKVTKIRREIGQKPILSWGNSSGDFPMFHYTNIDNPLPHISFCLICDDMERENGNPSKAKKCLDACQKYGWQAVSMHDEWWTIYGPSAKKIK